MTSTVRIKTKLKNNVEDAFKVIISGGRYYPPDIINLPPNYNKQQEHVPKNNVG
ncbi:MAG: hypothetical protein V2A69_05505 [Pseudomonadota bacterium]